MMVSIERNENSFDTDIAHNILNNEELSNRLINNIVEALSNKGYEGISIMPVYIYPSDRDLYVEFLVELIGRVHAMGFKVFDTIITDTFELITDIFSTQSYIKFINELVDSSVFSQFQLASEKMHQ